MKLGKSFTVLFEGHRYSLNARGISVILSKLGKLRNSDNNYLISSRDHLAAR